MINGRGLKYVAAASGLVKDPGTGICLDNGCSSNCHVCEAHGREVHAVQSRARFRLRGLLTNELQGRWTCAISNDGSQTSAISVPIDQRWNVSWVGRVAGAHWI